VRRAIEIGRAPNETSCVACGADEQQAGTRSGEGKVGGTVTFTFSEANGTINTQSVKTT